MCIFSYLSIYLFIHCLYYIYIHYSTYPNLLQTMSKSPDPSWRNRPLPYPVVVTPPASETDHYPRVSFFFRASAHR